MRITVSLKKAIKKKLKAQARLKNNTLEAGVFPPSPPLSPSLRRESVELERFYPCRFCGVESPDMYFAERSICVICNVFSSETVATDDSEMSAVEEDCPTPQE